MKHLKSIITLLVLVPFVLLIGCNDLFDTGDTQRTFEGTVLEFKPLTQEVSLNDDGTAVVTVQLIGPQRESDLTADFSVDGESTAVAGEHYELITSSPVTISAGTSSADIVINLLENEDFEGEVTLLLNLEGGSDGIEAAVNLSRATIFIGE